MLLLFRGSGEWLRHAIAPATATGATASSSELAVSPTADIDGVGLSEPIAARVRMPSSDHDSPTPHGGHGKSRRVSAAPTEEPPPEIADKGPLQDGTVATALPTSPRPPFARVREVEPPVTQQIVSRRFPPRAPPGASSPLDQRDVI